MAGTWVNGTGELCSKQRPSTYKGPVAGRSCVFEDKETSGPGVGTEEAYGTGFVAFQPLHGCVQLCSHDELSLGPRCLHVAGVALGAPPSLAVGPEVTLGAVGKCKATVVRPRGLGAHSSRRSVVTVMAQGREPQPTSHPWLAACLHRQDPRDGNEGIPGGGPCAHGRTEGTTWWMSPLARRPFGCVPSRRQEPLTGKPERWVPTGPSR